MEGEKTELKTCPFCGHSAELTRIFHGDSPYHHVVCCGCGCQTKGVNHPPSKVVNLWNKRVLAA